VCRGGVVLCGGVETRCSRDFGAQARLRTSFREGSKSERVASPKCGGLALARLRPRFRDCFGKPVRASSSLVRRFFLDGIRECRM
jgi:hypothetical protein